MKTLITLILGLMVVVSVDAQNRTGVSGESRTNRTSSRNSGTTSNSSSTTNRGSASTNSSSNKSGNSVVGNQSVRPQNNTQGQTTIKNDNDFTSIKSSDVERRSNNQNYSGGNSSNSNNRGNSQGNNPNYNNRNDRGRTQGNPSNPQDVPSRNNGYNNGYNNNNNNGHNNNGGGYNPNYQPHQSSHGHNPVYRPGTTSPAGAPMSPSVTPRPYYGSSFPYKHVYRPTSVYSLRDAYISRPYQVTTTMLVSIYGISDIDASKLTLGLPTNINVINEYGTFERRVVSHADLLLAVRSVGYNYRRQMEYVLELIDLHDYSLIATWQIDNFFNKEEWNIERCLEGNRYEIQRIMVDWDRLHY